MELTSLFVIYLILFRLAIIAAGVISIILGYLLFVKGIWPEGSMEKGTSVDIDLVKSRFTMKNAAPGTCFALFGVIIISTMFATGGPEFLVEQPIFSPSKKTENQTQLAQQTGRLLMRGEKEEGLFSLVKKGVSLEKDNKTDAAISSYEDAIRLMGDPLNNLAWLYFEKGRLEDAMSLSKVAVSLDPDNANYLDTLAEILAASGQPDEALELMEKAARIDPELEEKLSRFRSN